MNIVFTSNVHIRYQNGSRVDPVGTGIRAIKILSQEAADEGCVVTIYNLDGGHPSWHDAIHMAPKRMKIVKQTDNVVELRGVGQDQLGVSFEDYGLTLYMSAQLVQKCVLHNYSRKIDYEYLDEPNFSPNVVPDILSLAWMALDLYNEKNAKLSHIFLIKLFEEVNKNPMLLKKIKKHKAIAYAFYTMIKEKVIHNEQELEKILSIAYFFLSKHINYTPNDYHSIFIRLYLLNITGSSFIKIIKNTVGKKYDLYTDIFNKVNNDNYNNMILFSLIISDVEYNYNNMSHSKYVVNMKNRYEKMFEENYFNSTLSLKDVAKNGVEYHKIIYKYLENKIINENSIEY